MHSTLTIKSFKMFLKLSFQS